MTYSPRPSDSPRFLSYEEFEGRLCLSSVSFASHDIILATDSTRSVFAADLDGDDDVDVLWTGFSKVAWYENTNGKGSFGAEKVIGVGSSGSEWAHAADVDGDGDLDVLTASSADFGFTNTAWYENTDGKGSFGPRKVIGVGDSGFSSPWVYATDVDGDGDVDALSSVDDKIAWYENIDGKGSFGPQKVIATVASGASSVYAADLDGDGDVDVLATSRFGTEIAWYENSDGKGIFGGQRVIKGGTIKDRGTSVFPADVDGDGDVDVLAARSSCMRTCESGRIIWYESTDVEGRFGQEKVISGGEMGEFFTSVYATDVEGDGDLDVLSFANGTVAWHENRDGRGDFDEPKVIATNAAEARSVYAVDLDVDGDVDILSTDGNQITWYEQLPQVAAGDANRDFQFDQLDIVQVLQAAKYLAGEPATFEEGDWNGDGVFDQLDIVAALQTGNYLQGPYATRAVDAVFGQT